MTRSRLLTGMYLLGRRRAEAKAQRERNDLIDRFECLNEATNAEIRSLRDEVFRRNLIEDASAVERDETQRWLH